MLHTAIRNHTHQINTSRFRVVAVLLAMSLIAAACGGGSSGTTTPAATEAAGNTTVAPPATSTVPAADATSGATADDSNSAASSSQVDLTKTVEGAQSGGTLRIAVEAESDGLNPTVNNFAVSAFQMANTVLEPLFTWDATGQPTPYLVKTSESSDDGLSFTIHLRSGITFTDGAALNADAVIANFEGQLADPIISLALRPRLNVDNPVEKIDDLSVRFNLVSPNKQFATTLSDQLGMIGSPKWLAAARDDQSLNQQPVGTGPFVFDKRVQDQSTRFVRNPDWWQTRVNGTPVYLDAVEFFPITDGSVAMAGLLAGDLDSIGTTDANAILSVRDEGDSFIRIEDDQGEESFSMMNTSAPPFDDIRARQAITFATPRRNYLEFAGGGILRPADTMFPPELVWNNPDVVQEGDMADKAAPLVDAYCSDLPDNCTDGRINIDYEYFGPSVDEENIADLLTAGWGDFFNVNRSVKLQDDLITDVALGLYQIVAWRQFGAPDPAADRVWLACDSIGLVSLNWPRYCDQSREQLLNDAQSTTDLSKRVEIWKEIQQKVHDDYTYIFFTRTLWMNAFDAKVRNECGATSPDGVPLLCTNNGGMFTHQMWIDQG